MNRPIEAVFESIKSKVDQLEGLSEEISYEINSDSPAEEIFIDIDRRARQAIALLQAVKDEAYEGRLKAVRS